MTLPPSNFGDRHVRQWVQRHEDEAAGLFREIESEMTARILGFEDAQEVVAWVDSVDTQAYAVFEHLFGGGESDAVCASILAHKDCSGTSGQGAPFNALEKVVTAALSVKKLPGAVAESPVCDSRQGLPQVRGEPDTIEIFGRHGAVGERESRVPSLLLNTLVSADVETLVQVALTAPRQKPDYAGLLRLWEEMEALCAGRLYLAIPEGFMGPYFGGYYFVHDLAVLRLDTSASTDARRSASVDVAEGYRRWVERHAPAFCVESEVSAYLESRGYVGAAGVMDAVNHKIRTVLDAAIASCEDRGSVAVEPEDVGVKRREDLGFWSRQSRVET